MVDRSARGRSRRPWLVVGGLVGALAVGAAWIAASQGAGGPSPAPVATPTPTVSPSPEEATYQLVFDLRRVRGHSVAGTVRPRRLDGAARAVQETITELYADGFVDPARWQGGRFPGIPRLFAPSVRDEVRARLGRISLGPTARSLDAVRPRRATLDVEVLTDARGHAVVAVASARLEAVGLSDDATVTLWHEGDYTLRRSRGAWRIVAYDVRGRVPSPGEVRGERRGASLWPELTPDEPLFVLVIGSDARPGHAVARARADSIHILGVNPRQGRASIVGIPRDSLVPIPGFGTAKINEALYRGGPELMVDTVERLTGVRIDAYALTGFEGFEQLVAAIGGVPVRIPYEMSDPYSRASFRPGLTRLSGREALQFSRDRHDAPGGDFGRSLNQGRFMIAAFRELREDLGRGQLAMVPWAIAGARYVRTDLGLTEILDLLLTARSIDPARIRNRVVSGHGAMVGGRSVVLLGTEAQATFRDLARDAVLGG